MDLDTKLLTIAMLQELLQCNIAMLLMLQELIFASLFCKNGTLQVREDNKKRKVYRLIANLVEKL